VEDSESGIVKSAFLDPVSGKMNNCALAQMPKYASIFDDADASTAKLITVEGKEVFAVGVETYLTKGMAPAAAPIDLELRIWQNPKTGAWKRFQIFDKKKVG
jgi:predicted metal-dependent TIM-barrel fold hydrolase